MEGEDERQNIGDHSSQQQQSRRGEEEVSSGAGGVPKQGSLQ